MTGEPWSIPAAAGGFGERSCPICAAALVVETMSGVKIDRCPIHGVWFDPQELETVLQHSVETLAGRPAGLVGWLKRLF
jgi:hypothetical protein